MVSKLRCVSPLDGRYSKSVNVLSNYFSEHALNRYRIGVEVEYLKALSGLCLIESFNKLELRYLNGMKKLPLSEVKIIKQIETKGYKGFKATNHDVKAVEYYLRDKLEGTTLESCSEFIHFALTSEDVSNIAYALMIRDSLNKVMVPKLKNLVNSLSALAEDTAAVPMLARTHGQPASPTTFGKEMRVFASRLESQLSELENQKISAKLNGATGNYNAHVVRYPDINWPDFSERFIGSFNSGKGVSLEANLVTTQIEPHDSYCRIFDNMRRINSILLDFSQGMWRYVSDDWLKLKIIKGEVGSSTMPHKVNPIDFENAEGNLGLANSLFTFFSVKLPVSRLQRDLSDSTVLRNIGSAFAYSLVSYSSLKRGLSKIAVNKDKILSDLKSHPEVLAEAVQILLRSYNVSNSYDIVKGLTRGSSFDMEKVKQIVQGLDISDNDKIAIGVAISRLSPESYLGIAEKLANSSR